MANEDKIREKNFLYKRSFGNYLSSKTVMLSTRDLMTRIQVKKNFFEDRQTFLQDAVTVLFNEKLMKKITNSDISSQQLIFPVNFVLTETQKLIYFELKNYLRSITYLKDFCIL